MTNFDFFKEGFKNLKTVGTISRTSKMVSRRMTTEADISSSNIIVELGAGDGAITKYILEQMKPTAKLYVFEMNPIFFSRLVKMKDPRLVFIQDSADKLEEYMDNYQLSQVDAIISAIPFVLLPEEEASSIVSKCKNILKSGGLYVQIHYSTVLKKLYEKIFGNVRIEFVAWNLPPAFVIVCRK